MYLSRALLAAALTAGLGISTLATADAAVTATINIVNNNVSTTIYHGKNPPSTQGDQFVGVSGWTVAPVDSLLAGASDYSAKITLGASQEVTFNFGSPNWANPFANSCSFSLRSNSLGTGFISPTSTKVGMASCAISAQTGRPYNFEAAVSGF